MNAAGHFLRALRPAAPTPAIAAAETELNRARDAGDWPAVADAADALSRAVRASDTLRT